MNKLIIRTALNRWRKRDEAIEAIARDILDIETLTERKRDSLDFHEVSVWQLRDALLAAYKLGAGDVYLDVAFDAAGEEAITNG